MNTRDNLEELIDHEKSECRSEFMSQKAYYRSMLIGIAAMLGIASATIAWALSVSTDTGSMKSTIYSNTKRINTIEQIQRANHNEQMRVLMEIKERVTR